jgi:Uma2 family endonuclease
MGVAITETFAGRMSGSEFRSFQERRHDRERWVLMAGVPMLMTPPTITHNRIASNLERLLDGALDLHDPSRIAVQRPGIELGSGDDGPEPDAGVIDADYGEEQRFVERAYLLAEIVSGSDDVPVPGTPERWIDVKRESISATRLAKHCSSSSKGASRLKSTSRRRAAGHRRRSADRG